MLNIVNSQQKLVDILDGLKGTGNIPATATVKKYEGEIQIDKLSVSIVRFPGLLVNWTGAGEIIDPAERDDKLRFSILICDNSINGGINTLPIIDTLNEHFLGLWNDDDGNRLFNISREAVKPVFTTATYQVIAYTIAITE